MAAYLDTSILIPLFFAEPASRAARERLRKEPGITLSRWTLAEFASAAAFKIRTGQTDEVTAQQALGKLHALVAGGELPVAEVVAADFDRAAQLCTAHASALRTPDALHAAIAARLKQPILTCDCGLAQGCHYHGIAHELIDAP
jgi:uncharacterized protein